MRSLKEFKSVSQKITRILEDFPIECRIKILFDKWNLKDVVAHLNNWMVHDIDCLTSLKQNKEPFWEPNVGNFNKTGIEKRRSMTWDEVFKEFITLKNNLLNIYETLPSNLWDQPIWKNKHKTARLFLEEDVYHWKEHLVVLENKFEEVKINPVF